MAQMIAVVSGKGGVGKSTISCGLGCSLARLGKKVLLIDCDTCLRCLDYLLGISQELVLDISDIAKGRCAPLKAVYSCNFCPGLYLLPTSQNHEDAVPVSMMKRIVSFLGKYFDVVILDSPAGLGRDFQTAVSCVEHTFIVATPDPVSLRDADLVRRSLEQFELRSKRLLINKFHYGLFKKSGLYKSLDEAINTAGIQLLGIIPHDPAVIVASGQSRPLPAASASMKAFHRIAARINGERVPIPLKKL